MSAEQKDGKPTQKKPTWKLASREEGDRVRFYICPMEHGTTPPSEVEGADLIGDFEKGILEKVPDVCHLIRLALGSYYAVVVADRDGGIPMDFQEMAPPDAPQGNA